METNNEAREYYFERLLNSYGDYWILVVFAFDKERELRVKKAKATIDVQDRAFYVDDDYAIEFELI